MRSDPNTLELAELTALLQQFIGRELDRQSPEQVCLFFGACRALYELGRRVLDRHTERLGDTEPARRPPDAARIGEDTWLHPADAASRLGHSVRWLARRRFSPEFAGVIVPQEKRGWMVSSRGLAQYMSRKRERD